MTKNPSLGLQKCSAVQPSENNAKKGDFLLCSVGGRRPVTSCSPVWCHERKKSPQKRGCLPGSEKAAAERRGGLFPIRHLQVMMDVSCWPEVTCRRFEAVL